MRDAGAVGATVLMICVFADAVVVFSWVAIQNCTSISIRTNEQEAHAIPKGHQRNRYTCLWVESGAAVGGRADHGVSVSQFLALC
jgi:hypothetical protein